MTRSITGEPFTTRFGCHCTDQERAGFAVGGGPAVPAPAAVTNKKINAHRKALPPERRNAVTQFRLQSFFSKLFSLGSHLKNSHPARVIFGGLFWSQPMIRPSFISALLKSLPVVCCAVLLTVAGEGQNPNSYTPPIPPVLSVTPLGSIVQNPDIDGRDGAISALINGRSVWTFGDTPMSVAGSNGQFWDDNSLSWTTNLDASKGITLDHDFLDSTGAPGEFLPYTAEEAAYNYAHDKRHCTAKPCGAEFAMWPGQPVPDQANNRVLIFYSELWRVPGQNGWTNVGGGIAVAGPGWKIERPIENPGSPTPTLMWGQKDQSYVGGSIVVQGTMFSYGCKPDFVQMDCRVARVPLSSALDKTQWTYYAGHGQWSTNPDDAVTVLQGGAAGNSIFYNRYLGVYMVIYSAPLSDNLCYRVSYSPWGPWSAQTLLFVGETGWDNNLDYAGEAHTEFAEGDGQTQYITYAHSTGLLRSDLPLVKVVFGRPAK